MGFGYCIARVRAILHLLKALDSAYALQVTQNWEVGMMLADHLRQIADELTKEINEAKAKDEKERNGG